MRPFVLRGHERPINVVKFNYDGDLFFSASADNKVNMWESYTGERIGSFATKAAVKTIDIDDNTSYLFSGGMDGTVQVQLLLNIDLQTGEWPATQMVQIPQQSQVY